MRLARHLACRLRTRSVAALFATALIPICGCGTQSAATPDGATDAGNLDSGSDSTSQESGGSVTDATSPPQLEGGAHDASTSNPPPPGTDVTVDFRTAVYPLDKWSVGATISTYSGSGTANIKSSSWAAKLASLGPLSWRIPLRYAGGNPGSGAGGAQTSGDAVTYITTIRSSMAGTPYVVLSGDTSDNGLTASDVSGFIHYFNDNNGARAGAKLERIVLGNEPDNGGGGTAYLAQLDAWINAAKGADPSILVAAPAAAYWDTGLLTSAATHPIDILSYHAYDGANTDGTGFPVTLQYHAHIGDMRTMKPGIQYGCEEFNYHFNASVSGFLDWHDLVFVASVIGQVVSAGGHANEYSDSNGPLGLLNDGTGQGQPGALGDPLPAFYGIGMWTGMNGTFRGYGAHTVSASAKSADLDAFATDNGKVMLLNKSASAAHTVTVGFGGRTAGTYSAWQTSMSAPTSAPTKIVAAAGYSGATLSIQLPAGTVTSIELD
jgi:hypothetical protein